MNLSVCIDAVYRGKDFLEAMRELSSAGIKSFEFWSWWDKDIDQIRQAKDEFGMECVALCTHFISLVDGAKRDDYIAGLKESIKIAKSLGCSTLISQVGDDLGTSRAEQQQNLIDGLKACVPILEEANILLVFEPLNVRVDHAGYYLTHSDEAFEIAQAVDSKHVKILFDIYHQQITEGNLINNITNNIDLIGHFHAAGNPGRHELDIGEINYGAVFEAIRKVGYAGHIGLEYFPQNEPIQGILQTVAQFS